MIDAATRRNKLHQVSPRTETNPTASSTPATTLSTRCTLLTIVLAAVAWTTSSPVRAATSGGGSTRPSPSATKNAATEAPARRAARKTAERPR
jgi:hypothetical protein